VPNVNEIKIPDIGDVTDAEIIEVSVSVGDEIKIEDTLVVLETDKASMDVPSPEAGVVESIQCKVGDTVSEGSLLLTISSAAVATTAEQKAEEKTVAEEAPTNAKVEEVSAKVDIPAETSSATTIEEIRVPDLGQDGAVDVIEVSISEGDDIEMDQALVTLETEKASMEVPSPLAGKIISVAVKVSDQLSTGDLIATAEVSASVNKVDVVETTAADTTKVVKSEQPAPKSPSSASKPAAPVPDYPAIQSKPNMDAIYASPAIRRLAREFGADLTQVKGTGKKGRVIKEDVQQYIKYELSRPKATANSGLGQAPDLPEIDYSKFGQVEQVPLSRIQKVSSVNLSRNWMMIPHVTQHDEADITEMEAFRQQLKAEALAEGIRLTPLVFMMKAVVASLKQFPRFNASLANDGENLILKQYFHIGVAVDTPDGLVVPVVKNVDQKSLYELAQELGEISAKAREKKLGIDAMQGSCFTISSLGGIGGTAFTPIVNWPDVAILGVSKSQMKPIWNGKDFEPRLMLPLALSYDHRVIDGALAAKFTAHLAQSLTDIRRLLLK